MTIFLAGAVPSKFVSRQPGSRRASSSHRNQGAASTGALDNHCISAPPPPPSPPPHYHHHHTPPPQDFVKNLVTDGLGVELNNKVNEMNLILANHISDKVIDDVIDNLSR